MDLLQLPGCAFKWELQYIFQQGVWLNLLRVNPFQAISCNKLEQSFTQKKMY